MSIDDHGSPQLEWPEDDYELSDEGRKRMVTFERDLVFRAGVVRTNRRRRRALITILLLVATVAGFFLVIDNSSSKESSQERMVMNEPGEPDASPVIMDDVVSYPERTRPRMVVVRRSDGNGLQGVKIRRVDSNSISQGLNVRRIDDAELMMILIETGTAAAIRCRNKETGPSCELDLLDTGRS